MEWTHTNIYYYLNENLVATHTVNIAAAGSFFICYYIKTEAGGALALTLSQVRLWYNDYIN